jgi:hypothetical protein
LESSAAVPLARPSSVRTGSHGLGAADIAFATWRRQANRFLSERSTFVLDQSTGLGLCCWTSDIAKMTDLPHPPWAVAADETPASVSAEFGPCDEVISQFAAKTGAKLGRATYTTSLQWGRIVRVTIAMPSLSEPRATCWIQPDGKVNFVVDFSPDGTRDTNDVR